MDSFILMFVQCTMLYQKKKKIKNKNPRLQIESKIQETTDVCQKNKQTNKKH